MAHGSKIQGDFDDSTLGMPTWKDIGFPSSGAWMCHGIAGACNGGVTADPSPGGPLRRG